MIKSIYLESFKAFGHPAKFELEYNGRCRNMLIYGENGSGKSSLYEALCLFFYEERLLRNLKKEGQAEEVYEANKQSFLRSYNNQKAANDYVLKINNQLNSVFPIASQACYLFCGQDIQIGETLRGIDFLQNCTLPEFDANQFWKDHGTELIQNVNDSIKKLCLLAS